MVKIGGLIKMKEGTQDKKSMEGGEDGYAKT